MNVASLELSRELYELSGWGATEVKWCHTDEIGDFVLRLDHPNWKPGYYLTEAYDLGYTLSKLPNDIYLSHHSHAWHIEHDDNNPANQVELTAETPEDAAAKLAIELFKQGILKKETK